MQTSSYHVIAVLILLMIVIIYLLADALSLPSYMYANLRTQGEVPPTCPLHHSASVPSHSHSQPS